MIAYTVQTHPRARHLKIKVLPNGEVVVVKPKFGWFQKNVDAFVQENETWIQNAVAKVKNRQVKKPATRENEISIFGKSYVRKVELSAHHKIGVHIVEDTLVINPVTQSEKSVERALTSFLKSTAEKYILPRTLQLGKVMDIAYEHITLRNQSTRWGSCSSLGNLNFNWKLVHCPPAVIDYVIIHELAHRKQMNHSAKFWDIVRKFDPEYNKHRGWLRKQGMDLG